MQTNGIYSFKRVIDEILRNMVNEISPDGTCSFSEIVALKLLSKISRNSNIFRL